MSGNSHSFAIYLLSYDHLCRDKWSRFVFFSMQFLWLFYSSSVTTLSRCVLPERKTDPSSPSSIWGLSLCLLTGLCFFAFIFLVGPLLPLHGVYLVRLWVNFVLYFIPLILSNCWLFVRNFLWCHIYPAVYCIWDMVGLCTILISLCVHFCLAALYILGLGCQGQLYKLAIHCSIQASNHTWSQLQIRIISY